MPASPLDKLRRICLALPGVSDVPAWGTSTFRCPKIFAMYAQPSDQKHSQGRPGVWIKAGPGNQEFMVRDDPKRYYVPPYVGTSGWVGIFLDQDPNWDEIALLIEDGWRLLAPKTLVKARDAGESVAPVAVKSRAGQARAKPATKKGATKKGATKKAATKKRAPAKPKRAPAKKAAKKK